MLKQTLGSELLRVAHLSTSRLLSLQNALSIEPRPPGLQFPSLVRTLGTHFYS